MSPSFPNKRRTKLVQAIVGLLMASVIVLAISDLIAQSPKPEKLRNKAQAKPKATVKGPKSTKPTRKAQATPTPSGPEEPQCDWPPQNDDAKCKVLKAFTAVIKRSTEDQTYRDELLKCDPAKDCSLGRKAVQDILGAEIPIPPKHLVIFYYDPTKPGGTANPFKDSLPANHCYTTISLPSIKVPPPPEYWKKSPATIFSEHFRCCYPPWAPIGPCENP